MSQYSRTVVWLVGRYLIREDGKSRAFTGSNWLANEPTPNGFAKGLYELLLPRPNTDRSPSPITLTEATGNRSNLTRRNSPAAPAYPRKTTTDNRITHAKRNQTTNTNTHRSHILPPLLLLPSTTPLSTNYHQPSTIIVPTNNPTTQNIINNGPYQANCP